MNSAQPRPFEVYDYSGDLRIVAWGEDYLEALAHASSALLDQIVDLHNIQERESLSISVSGNDRESQAIALLNELLFLVHARQWLCCRVQTLTLCSRKGCSELEATLAGETVDATRHPFKYDIKAVTYHDFKIVEMGGRTTLEFICDL